MQNGFSLRDYQIDALDTIHKDLKTEPVVLLQAVMGAGKTVTVCRLVNRYWHETDRRFLILAHKQELVEQFYNTFQKMTLVPAMGTGICCAGLGDRDMTKRLTIGSVQTFVNFREEYPGCDLLIIDEAHRVSIGTGSQYDQTIEALRAKTPDMRILGVTATPSRLGHGYIYGDKCKPGAVNLFPRLNHQIKYQTLREQGYLCQMHGQIAHADSLINDLATVQVNGDYVLNSLGEIMSREIHLDTAAQAIRQYCGAYNHVCVFCCTIDHAERLQRIIGDDCTIIHSQLTQMERVGNLKAWQTGKKRICTSINILAEGFDFPPLDCLVMARPTLSSTLYLQAVGRALRTHPGKDHALLLDLTDNTARFGTDLDKVRVTIPKAVDAAIQKENENNKICPMCESWVYKSLRICPECAFEWPVAEIVEANSVPDLKPVNFEPKPPRWVDIQEMWHDIHKAKSGKELGKVTLTYRGFSAYKPEYVNLWFCLPDYYTGFAVEKARDLWRQFAPDWPLPDTVEAFANDAKGLPQPTRMLIDESGQYAELLELEFDDRLPYVPDTQVEYSDDIPF